MGEKINVLFLFIMMRSFVFIIDFMNKDFLFVVDRVLNKCGKIWYRYIVGCFFIFFLVIDII